MNANAIHRRLRPAARALILAVLMGVFALVTPATATARTQVERFRSEFGPEPDPFYSEQCGTQVEVTGDIHFTHHSFDDDPLRHRAEERGRIVWSSDHGTVIHVWRHAGVHEVVEVLEKLEPEVFLVRVTAEANGMLELRSLDGRRLARDAGTVTYEDIAVWDRSVDALVAGLERTVVEAKGPHPLLDDAFFYETVCAELAP